MRMCIIHESSNGPTEDEFDEINMRTNEPGRGINVVDRATD